MILNKTFTSRIQCYFVWSCGWGSASCQLPLSMFQCSNVNALTSIESYECITWSDGSNVTLGNRPKNVLWKSRSLQLSVLTVDSARDQTTKPVCPAIYNQLLFFCTLLLYTHIKCSICSRRLRPTMEPGNGSWDDLYGRRSRKPRVADNRNVNMVE